MAKRSSTSTCCLTLPLRLERWQEDRLAKRFRIAGQIYNTLLGYELKRYRQLCQTKAYRAVQSSLSEQFKANAKGSKEYKALCNQRTKMLNDAGFTEYGFIADIKRFYKHFSDNIGSSVAYHCIASQVWTAFEKMLYGNGKQVHFKKKDDMDSLKGGSVTGKSGGVEIMFKGDYIEWKGLRMPLKLDPRNDYEQQMLTYRVKYVRILRKPGKNRTRWYAQLSLEGIPAVKFNRETGELRHPVGHGAVGLDIGPQTLAYSSHDEVNLVELADQVQNIEQQKRVLMRKLDRSRRATNPDNYNPDGTFKRGVKLTHFKSKRYLKTQHELAYLYHRQTETRKRQHIALANHLLSLGDCFYVEDMDWPSLTHRAKKTEVSEKTGKFKRKKRFGKSVANKAPATLINILSLKCASLGFPGVQKVPLRVRASQYNHITDTYEKKSLSQRWNVMPDGTRIQRDLYSAFLLQHMLSDLSDFDKDTLADDYPRFVLLHHQAVEQLSHSKHTLSSMGIVRTVS